MKLSKSPMQDYIAKFDLKYINSGYNDYWVTAASQDWHTWNTLFFNELMFRESHVKNVVFSIEGEQGEGKSAGLLRLLTIISEVYKNRFKLDYLHFFQEDFEADLKKAKKRTSHGLDEQPRIHGVMANMVQDQLANFEDIYRKSQISIGYASPSLRRHEHFFIFEALGDIEIGEDGEPSTVQLMLKTRRKSDRLIMPRGILKLKWPDRKLWKNYNLKKDKFINKMQSKQGALMDKIEKDAAKVIKKYKKKLYRELKDGVSVPASKDTIKYYIHKELGVRSYTIEGFRLIMESIRAKL